MKNGVLIAGPWVGEFGWELFCWQGYLRNLSKNYDKTVVISRKGHRFLYRDFCDDYIGFDSPTANANMWLGKVNNQELNKILKSVRHTQYLKPFDIGFSGAGGKTTVTKKQFNEQKFVKYTSNSITSKYDILIHARNKYVGAERNWRNDNWQKLVDSLKDDYRIATIGSHESLSFDGVDDKRNLSIDKTVALMNRTDLVVGPSSGPMHLASLAGAKHLVWSAPLNEMRYKEQWNPFKTEVIFYDKENWNPKVDTITGMIKDAV